MADDPDVRIDLGERRPRALHLRPADGGGGVDDLPLQVGEIDRVVVDDADGADTRRRQIEKERRAETAGADDEDAARQQLRLPRPADLIEENVPGVTVNLGIGKLPGDIARHVRTPSRRRCRRTGPSTGSARRMTAG